MHAWRPSVAEASQSDAAIRSMPRCHASGGHELDRFLVCRCAACGLEFRPPERVPTRHPITPLRTQVVALLEDLLGLAVLASLRGLALAVGALARLFVAFAVLTVLVYFALRWAGGF